MQKNKKNKKNTKIEFSLIHLLIFFIVVGFISIAVITTTKIYQETRVKNLVKEMSTVRHATNMFLGYYKQYPGDYQMAGKHIVSTVGGNGNGKIEWPKESMHSFVQLVNGHFLDLDLVKNSDMMRTVRLSFNKDSCFQPMVHPSSDKGNAMDGHAVQENGDMDYPVTVIGLDGKHAGNNCNGAMFYPSIVEDLDKKIDDGKPFSGEFRIRLIRGFVYPPVMSGVFGDDCVDNLSRIYNSYGKKKSCNLMFRAD